MKKSKPRIIIENIGVVIAAWAVALVLGTMIVKVSAPVVTFIWNLF